jgi:hypothetical protein
MPLTDPEKKRKALNSHAKWLKGKIKADPEWAEKRRICQNETKKRKYHSDLINNRRVKSDYARNRAATDPEYVKNRDAKAAIRVADRIVVAKKLLDEFRKDGCRACAEKSHDCLQAHHRNPKTKKHTVALIVRGSYAEKTIIEELKKCICLCANCHMKLHAGKRRREKRNAR